MTDELIRQDAVTIIARLKGGEITPHDLLDALEKRIAAVDGAVNALPTRCFDRSRAHADRLMKKPVAERGRPGHAGLLAEMHRRLWALIRDEAATADREMQRV